MPPERALGFYENSDAPMSARRRRLHHQDAKDAKFFLAAKPRSLALTV